MRRLPLFPLPVVLFPGAAMPLHIFEPRYRQMLAHCLEGDKRFGLLYHDPDRHGAFHMDGQVGCVAEIQEFQPLPDGRSLVLVHGEERFRVEDGIESDSLYYEGLVDEYGDVEPDPVRILQRRRDSLRLFQHVMQQLTQAIPRPVIEETREVSFQLAQWIRVDAWWQQELLEMRSEEDRLERLDRLLLSVRDHAQ